MAHILAVVTSVQTLPAGAPTGFWLQELAAPYHRFREAGHTVQIASPAGGTVHHDPASETDAMICEDGRRFLDMAEEREALATTTALADVDLTEIDALFLVGGIGAAVDFNDNLVLDDAIAKLLIAGKPVAAVCHGVIGLTSVRGPDGARIAKGETMTGFSRDEEVALDILPIVPVVPEERLLEVGANYIRAEEPFGVCVAEGKSFVTGQNPASAGPAALALLSRLPANRK